MVNNCCIVCGCDTPKALTSFFSIDDDVFIQKLRLRLSLTEFRKQQIPIVVQEDYNLKNYDARVDGIILCKYGLYTSEHTQISLDSFEDVINLQLCICNSCFAVIDIGERSKTSKQIRSAVIGRHGATSTSSKRGSSQRSQRSDSAEVPDSGDSSSSSDQSDSDDSTPIASITEDGSTVVIYKPPMDAIANGNWIGYLPTRFASISRTEEQTIALMILNIYLSTVITLDN